MPGIRAIILAALGMAMLAVAGSPAAAQQVPLALRAQAVGQAALARASELQDSAWVDACGVWRVLDRSPRWAELLDPRVRARVRGDTARCGERPAEARGGLWIVTGVTRGGPDVILVTATYLVPYSRERTETCVVGRSGDGEWRVTEIRLDRSIEKVGQPLIPGPVRPEE